MHLPIAPCGLDSDGAGLLGRLSGDLRLTGARLGCSRREGTVTEARRKGTIAVTDFWRDLMLQRRVLPYFDNQNGLYGVGTAEGVLFVVETPLLK
jgi:hypothetical protein